MTPVTSLVVVKPNETKAVEPVEADSANRLSLGFGGGYRGGLAAPVAHFAPQSISGLQGLAGPPPSRPFSMSHAFFRRKSASSSSNPSSSTQPLGLPPSLVARPSISYGMSMAGMFQSALIVPNAVVAEDVHDTYSGGLYMAPITTPRWVVPTSQLTTPRTKISEVTDLLVALPWLKTLVSEPDLLTLAGKTYHIGNNQTVVEDKTCDVTSLGKSGNCKLIFNCPSIHSKLNDVEEYKIYFCALESDK